MDEATYKNLLLETIDTMLKEDQKKLANCGTTKDKRAIRSEFLRQHNEKTKGVLTDIDTNLKV